MIATSDLPAAPADALAHSQALQQRIIDTINAQPDGLLPFSDYMGMALYEPGLGYYSGGSRKFGQAGDFITAPGLSALFGQCLAVQTAAALQQLQTGSVLEVGAGDGLLCVDMLSELERLDCLPQDYLILEPSPDLRQRQYQRVSGTLAPALAARVTWLDQPPDRLVGVVLANEVIDALPVERFRRRGQILEQCCIKLGKSGLELAFRPAPNDLLQALEILPDGLPEGYQSEINPALPAWLGSISAGLECGLMLFIDYGFTRSDFYRPDRIDGTLQCHYRHHVHADALFLPGLQDITASVDFTALAEAASAQQLQVCGYASQASFLLNCGIDSLIQRGLQEQPQQHLQLAQQARTLLMPAQMGERIQVMALSRRLQADWCGFQRGDRRHAL